MRDAISNICDEIMSPEVLPLLRPTANNTAKVEPAMDCMQLNSNAKEPHVLKKFTFLGYMLGWSLRNMGGLNIDLPLAFWRRLCDDSTSASDKEYVYTVEEMREVDVFRAELLK